MFKIFIYVLVVIIYYVNFVEEMICLFLYVLGLDIFFIRKYMIFFKKGGIYSGMLSIYMRLNLLNELIYV